MKCRKQYVPGERSNHKTLYLDSVVSSWDEGTTSWSASTAPSTNASGSPEGDDDPKSVAVALALGGMVVVDGENPST
jgi:hypothetical protein